MSPETYALEELQHDALVELVNLGVSRAALSLREMAGEEVILSVPAVSTVNPQQAAEMIGGVRDTLLLAVEQGFDGELSGRALLIFPAPSGLELVRAVTGEQLPETELSSAASEALCETGNVLLQACLGTMANTLNRTLTVALPHLVRGHAQDFFPREAHGVVLFVYINFQLRGRRIRGYIALLLDLPAMQALRKLLDDFIERSTG